MAVGLHVQTHLWSEYPAAAAAFKRLIPPSPAGKIKTKLFKKPLVLLNHNSMIVTIKFKLSHSVKFTAYDYKQ